MTGEKVGDILMYECIGLFATVLFCLVFLSLIPILIFFAINALFIVYVIENPVLYFYKHKTEVIVDVSEFPMQDLGEDLNNFINTYNEFYSSKNQFKVYFERSINKRNQIIARLESDNGNVKACTLNNLRLLEKYQDIAWCYKCDIEQ